eukprot:m.1649717 g.1649717  ORF g.1649717 m.1649717 type:complete len:72 (+) comp83716_c0_seq1:139-354(+)
MCVVVTTPSLVFTTIGWQCLGGIVKTVVSLSYRNMCASLGMFCVDWVEPFTDLLRSQSACHIDSLHCCEVV